MSERSKKLVRLALNEKENNFSEDLSSPIPSTSSPPRSLPPDVQGFIFDSDFSDVDETYAPPDLNSNASSSNNDDSNDSSIKQSKMNVKRKRRGATKDVSQFFNIERTNNNMPLKSINGENIIGQRNAEQCNENGDILDQVQGKKKWSRSVRKERTKLLHTGQSYINVNGRKIEGRKIRPLKQCRKKCYLVLNSEVQKTLFTEYWALGSHDKRVAFIAGLITNKEKQVTRHRKSDSGKNREVTYQYNFEINGKRVPVCKDCFCRTLDEKEKFIRTVLKNKSQRMSGITEGDKRGRQCSANKKTAIEIDEVVRHINSFPAHESHYTRKINDKKYLPSHLNLRIMYDLYKEGKDRVVSRTIYEREFHKLKLSFKKPYVDTCSKCDTLNMQLKVATDLKNVEEKTNVENLLKAHQDAAALAYDSKKVDKQEATLDTTKRCFSFDLQQCLPTPFLGSSVVFYKRQLWTFNLTIHDNVTGESTNYMWHEATAGRGANEIASCLYYHLRNLPDTVKEVTFYSDTCGGQNKNSHVAAMFLKAICDFPQLNCINHKFLIPGHTHMECDVDHSLIEKRKKKLEFQIFHPHDWYQLVRSTGKKRPFIVHEMKQEEIFDFAKLLKDQLVVRKKNLIGEPFKWHSVQWLQYKKETFGNLNYKNSINVEEPFSCVSFLRRGRNANLKQVLLEQKYNGMVPISIDKKNDLCDLLRLIPPIFHEFYLNLPTSADTTDQDPDLEEIEVDD